MAQRLITEMLKKNSDLRTPSNDLKDIGEETIYIDSGSNATPSIGSPSSESFSSSSSSHLSTSFSTITRSPSSVSSRSTSPEITSPLKSPYFSQTDDDEFSTIDLGPTNITIYHMQNEKKRLTTELASKQGAKETLGKQIGDLNKQMDALNREIELLANNLEVLEGDIYVKCLELNVQTC